MVEAKRDGILPALTPCDHTERCPCLAPPSRLRLRGWQHDDDFVDAGTRLEHVNRSVQRRPPTQRHELLRHFSADAGASSAGGNDGYHMHEAV